MSKEVRYYCDIEDCGLVVTEKDVREYDIVFTTETTEGRAVKPYLSPQEIYMCEKHHQQYLEAQPIKAHGAMGYNTYKMPTQLTQPIDRIKE
jgi:hypothetical protein